MQYVEGLRAQIDELLRPHVPSGEGVALVHFPSHRNPGDAAIGLGATHVIERHGATVKYLCCRESYDPALLRERVGSGTIFLNGGGSFGDHYTWEQAFRERVLADFPENPIVQLPQTMNFQARAAIDLARRAVEGHPRFTLFVRDAASRLAACEAFDVPTVLCPDTAFAWEPGTSAAPIRSRVLCLGRLDSESNGQIHRIVGPEVVQTDWPYAPVDAIRWPVRRALGRFARQQRSPAVRRAVDAGTRTLLPAMARATLVTACRALRQYRVVITDRLHGHVLSTLLGVPNVLLGDRHGKVRNFYDTWSSSEPHVAFANTHEEAIELARSLARSE